MSHIINGEIFSKGLLYPAAVNGPAAMIHTNGPIAMTKPNAMVTIPMMNQAQCVRRKKPTPTTTISIPRTILK